MLLWHLLIYQANPESSGLVAPQAHLQEAICSQVESVLTQNHRLRVPAALERLHPPLPSLTGASALMWLLDKLQPTSNGQTSTFQPPFYRLERTVGGTVGGRVLTPSRHFSSSAARRSSTWLCCQVHWPVYYCCW